MDGIVNVSYDVTVSDQDVRMIKDFMGSTGDDRRMVANYLERFGMSHLEKLRESRAADLDRQGATKQ